MSTLRTHRPVTPYLFVLPALGVLGVFLIASAVQVVYYSLHAYNPFQQTTEFVGLANYARLVNEPTFWRTLGNAFAYLLVTPVLILLSLACALVVDSKIKGSAWLRFLFFLPVITPTIVAAIAWRLLLTEESGLLNAGLTLVGLSPVGWLTTPPWTLISAMFVTIWKGFGFYMMIFLAGLIAVPKELREAIALDGAGRWGAFRHVVLPALRPTITLVVIISSIAALKVFDELFVTIRGVPAEQQTVVPYVYTLAFEDSDFGTACAAGLMLFVVILAFSIVNLVVTGGAKEERHA